MLAPPVDLAPPSRGNPGSATAVSDSLPQPTNWKLSVWWQRRGTLGTRLHYGPNFILFQSLNLIEKLSILTLNVRYDEPLKVQLALKMRARCRMFIVLLGCSCFPEIVQNFSERQILWSLCSVVFHALTFKLPIHTSLSVVPKFQVSLRSGGNWKFQEN